MGTTVSRLRLWRHGRKTESIWRLYTGTGGGAIFADTDCWIETFDCDIGGPGSLAYGDWTVASTAVVIGFSCARATTSCATSSTSTRSGPASTPPSSRSTTPSPPTASGPTGTILDGGYVHGTVTASVTGATDTTGIRALQVRVDGDRVVGTSPDRATCDFSRRSPCKPVTSNEEFSFDSRNIGDGTYTAQIGAIDAGRNFGSAGSRQITVDNTAPSAPAPTSPASLTTAATSAVVSWDNPPGQTAPITRAHVTVCGPTGCATTTQADTRTATIGLAQGFGTYTASVALEDAAGNLAPGNAATSAIAFAAASSLPPIATPQPGPAPVPTPTPVRKTGARLTVSRPSVARDGRTIVARGSVAPGATGRVTSDRDGPHRRPQPNRHAPRHDPQPPLRDPRATLLERLAHGDGDGPLRRRRDAPPGPRRAPREPAPTLTAPPRARAMSRVGPGVQATVPGSVAGPARRPLTNGPARSARNPA